MDYAEVYRLALLGLTNEQLAQFYDVEPQTIYNWQKKDAQFFEALKRGKLEADGKVAASMYKRATGYNYEEDHISVYQGEPVIVPTTKHIPPDVGAAKMWLKNRHPELWADSQRMEVTGKDGGPIEHHHGHIQIDLTDFSVEELKVLRKLNMQVQEQAEPASNGNGRAEARTNGEEQ
jgi:hypothetical protein